MKPLKLIVAIFSFLLVFACTTEEESSSVAPANLTLEENNTADSFIESLHDIAVTNKGLDNFIIYDIAMTSEGVFELKNQKSIDRTKHSDAFYRSLKYKNNITISGFNNNSQRTTVCCTTDGEEWGCVVCGGSPAEVSVCVIDQIHSCTNNGGCSTICPGEKSTLLYDASKGEFSIFKSFKNSK